MASKEWQFDGLVGPTHNYAGLSFGNVASEIHKHSTSNPRLAALQGVAKMRQVMRITGAQGVFLPHYRPLIPALERLGFEGSFSNMLRKSSNEAPELLASIYSSSAMWAANAATVVPSVDALDNKLHITPANLITKFHRSLEAPFTTRMLKRVFKDTSRFSVHEPLPSSLRFSDEGAANHFRIAPGHGERGVHVFVYGMSEGATSLPLRFPVRQHEEASRAIARMHKIDPERCFFVQQHPDAVDAGIFHHDVIGMNSQMFIAQHEKAWVGGVAGLQSCTDKLQMNSLQLLEISQSELPIEVAVRTYFFNSQLLSDVSGITIIAPMECSENLQTKALFDAWVQGNTPVKEVLYLDVRESMKNGGGPACLRLRVVMTEEEARAMHQGVVMTEALADALEAWIHRYYRDRLSFDDLRDPSLITEVEEALDALTQIVGLPGLYPFQ